MIDSLLAEHSTGPLVHLPNINFTQSFKKYFETVWCIDNKNLNDATLPSLIIFLEIQDTTTTNNNNNNDSDDFYNAP